MEKLNFCGVNVDSISQDELLERVLSLSEIDRAAQIVLLDKKLFMKAKFNKKLLNIINKSDLVIPISNTIRRGLKFLGHKLEKVYNPFRFTISNLSNFTENRKIVYLFGGNKKTIEKSELNLKKSYPGIRLLGKHHSKYKKDFEVKILTAMKKVSPDLVIVSMKKGKQEFWIDSKINQFKKGVFIGYDKLIETTALSLLSPGDKMFLSIKNNFKSIFYLPKRFIFSVFYIFILLITKFSKNNEI